MGQVKPFNSVNASLPGFVRSFKKISDRQMVIDAMADLLLDPLPMRLDFKKLKGYKNPNIYTVTICGNHAYKLSLEIKDEVAILRRVAAHKQIDDNP